MLSLLMLIHKDVPCGEGKWQRRLAAVFVVPGQSQVCYPFRDGFVETDLRLAEE